MGSYLRTQPVLFWTIGALCLTSSGSCSTQLSTSSSSPRISFFLSSCCFVAPTSLYKHFYSLPCSANRQFPSKVLQLTAQCFPRLANGCYLLILRLIYSSASPKPCTTNSSLMLASQTIGPTH